MALILIDVINAMGSPDLGREFLDAAGRAENTENMGSSEYGVRSDSSRSMLCGRANLVSPIIPDAGPRGRRR